MTPAYPSALRAWSFVAILVAAYAISFVDRQILGLLVQDLKHDLAISDSQIGLLQGPAFGIFYAAMGLPFGWLADKVSRTRLISIGLLLWTMMTLLGGLSGSFAMLFLTRMGVGVGEAALVPAAVSLLADSFAPTKRALPLATFTAGISVGAGLALILGGGLIAFAHAGASDLPLIGPWFAGRAPWQTVLMIAGLAGLPLAAAIAAMRDPARHKVGTTPDGESAARLFDHLRQHQALFVPLLLGASLLYLFSNAFSSWMPALFMRGFGWQPAMVGVRLGGVILAGALAGNALSGVVATMLVRRGRPEGALLTMTGGAVLLAPLAICGPLASDPLLAQLAVLLIYFALALCFGVATASFVAVTPPPLRGRVISLYLMLGNLVGLGLGPPIVGLLLQHVIADPARVGVAVALVAVPSVLGGLWLLVRALRPHAACAATVAG
ncbi:MFS transporter [Sphingomonas sp. AR_OL41]|uniref:MFS transporter n=1 Tax=Sphingomonas sp. AR_OL41 TaxID=3042729 RepID=UPI002481750B|nr:MFS transporter [Sphingomonas sp. AR_OL41]MDH7973221.1 MFS transporter [Sphingomonas sp. AR_OL41]